MKLKKIGLALSGGGQRAVAFHLGVLKTLYDKNILDNINIISAISGGSIIAACYLLKKSSFEEFYDTINKKLEVNIESKIVFNKFFLWRIAILLILILSFLYVVLIPNIPLILLLLLPIIFLPKYLFKVFPTGKCLQKVYDEVFYNYKSLKDLPDKPQVIFNSTNLQTGTLMTFSKKEINDSSYLYKYGHVPKFYTSEVPISFVVAASTGFAPLISPLKFDKKYFVDYSYAAKKKIIPELVDGGLYDNQGVYKLSKEKLDVLICSDASAPYDRVKYIAINPFGLLMRTISILMKRIRSFQYVDSIYNTPSISEIAYLSIDWQYDTCVNNFAYLALDNKVKKNILEGHSIPAHLLSYSNYEDKINKASQLIIYLRDKINYKEIIKGGLTNDQIKNISKISTRLCGLKKNDIKNLINHGKILTAIQLRLYCPSVFLNSYSTQQVI